MKWVKDFGAWVAIAGILASGLIGWGQITTKVDAHEQRLGKVEPDLAQNKTDVAVVKSNTETIMRALDRLEDRLGTKP